MIKAFNKLDNLVKFTICITLVFIMLILIKKIFPTEEIVLITKVDTIEITDNIKLQKIQDETASYLIDVSYPRFIYDEINNEIMNYIYDYVNEFKSKNENNTEKQQLIINYEIINKDTFMNLVFDINDSTDKYNDIKTYIINSKTNKFISIKDIYDEIELKGKINNLTNEKYSHYISNVVKDIDIDKFNYKFVEDKLYVHMNKSLFDYEMSYNPYVIIGDTEEIVDRVLDPNKPMIAFTFDDGPSDYTESVVKNLYLNGGRATFFMLGNKMKYKSDTLLNVLKYNMEIGSHTYAHKRLTKLTQEEVISELNTTKAIYKEITGNDIKYVRPPYGSLNSEVKSLIDNPIILWNMDTEDWLSRNPDKVYKYTMENLKDGNILLMHDVYETTLEAVKMVVPELIARGYQIVTVSELAESKGITLENHTSYRFIK